MGWTYAKEIDEDITKPALDYNIKRKRRNEDQYALGKSSYTKNTLIYHGMA